MANIKALGVCGSLRAESWNLKLLRNFLGEMQKEGFEPTLYPSLELPLVNEDLEKKPLPPSILDFRNAIEKADVVVVSSPEYNGSLSSALKNAIDWATRPPGNLWAGKIVVILGSSPGAFGAVRGAIHLRTILSGIKAWVIPEQVLLPFADKGFDSEGTLTNESTKKQMSLALESLKNFSHKMLQK